MEIKVCNRGELSHVVTGGHAKKHSNNADKNLLRKFLAWSEPANPKTLQDMEWAVRKSLPVIRNFDILGIVPPS